MFQFVKLDMATTMMMCQVSRLVLVVPLDTTRNYAANTRCRRCPRGTTTLAEGSTSRDDCGESRNNTCNKNAFPVGCVLATC